MEHPWLFLVKFFEMLGPGPAHFAHEYPHVIYSWLVMLLLIIAGIIGAKSITMIPGKAQNFLKWLSTASKTLWSMLPGKKVAGCSLWWQRFLYTFSSAT